MAHWVPKLGFIKMGWPVPYFDYAITTAANVGFSLLFPPQ
jgi:hypothetical protein